MGFTMFILSYNLAFRWADVNKEVILTLHVYEIANKAGDEKNNYQNLIKSLTSPSSYY